MMSTQAPAFSRPRHQPETPDTPLRHLLFVCSTAAMAGAEHNMIRLILALPPESWRCTVVVPDAGELSATCERHGIAVEILKRPRMYSTSFVIGGRWRIPNPAACAWDGAVVARYARRLARLMREHRPDLVVTKGMFAHLYGGVAARRAGVPCLWHVEDWVSERWGGLFRRLFGVFSRRLPTHIVACADTIVAQAPPGVRPRMEVIYNGVDAAAYRGGDRAAVRRHLGIPADAPVVGNVARLTPWKGQRQLLDAFSRVAARLPDARLVFVGSSLWEGDGFETSLKRRVAELKLDERVLFLGYRRDIPELLSAMDVFGYAALEKDTGPLSVLEAMALSLPVVAFDIPGVRMFVNEPTQGVLVPVGDVDALAGALVRVLQDPAERARLGHAARRRIDDALTFDVHRRRFEEVFTRLCPTGAGRTAS
jgi:glycosyltransferase involved in cell wall biosynthesis